jgi:hypothetical protein
MMAIDSSAVRISSCAREESGKEWQIIEITNIILMFLYFI